MYKILIFGPQGAGKGTQAERLSKTLGIPTMSTGQLLREEIKKESSVGKKVKAIIDAGDLVSDDVVLEMLKARLREPDASEGYIIDGYPRNIAQFKAYLSFDKPTHVLLIELPDDEALMRLSGRRMCIGCQKNYHVDFDAPKVAGICDVCGGSLIQRDDDRPDAIKRRLEIYHNDTQPIVAEFEKMGVLHKIDGSGSIDEVERLIKNELEIV